MSTANGTIKKITVDKQIQHALTVHGINFTKNEEKSSKILEDTLQKNKREELRAVSHVSK